jgi:transposase-like protein
VLGFRVGDRENQQAWEDLLKDLKQRGVKEVGMFVGDVECHCGQVRDGN